MRGYFFQPFGSMVKNEISELVKLSHKKQNPVKAVIENGRLIGRIRVGIKRTLRGLGIP